jgi:hypothetical protein
MNTEDDEFNRIERESVARKLAVQYALEKERQRETSPIPLITDEEWQALNNDE